MVVLLALTGLAAVDASRALPHGTQEIAHASEQPQLRELASSALTVSNPNSPVHCTIHLMRRHSAELANSIATTREQHGQWIAGEV